MILVLIGESASGKSTIERLLAERNPDFKKIVTYTTRPMRNGEVDGVDYHFVFENEFVQMLANDEFLESAKYRGWHYGSAKNDFSDGTNHIVILTPHGFRKLKKWARDNFVKVVSIYFKVDRRSRLIKILNRGDDIEEAYRRSLSDVGQFDGIEDEVDYTITNNEYRYDIETIYELVKRIIENERV